MSDRAADEAEAESSIDVQLERAYVGQAEELAAEVAEFVEQQVWPEDWSID